ncbi:FAD/NAD(P)-binding oxidoreductase, partial [Roseicella aquatilis]
MAAASAAAARKLSVLVVDEAAAPGGQIYRAVTETPVADRAVLGDDYWKGLALTEALEASEASILSGAALWYLDRDRKLGVSLRGQARMIGARHVVLATGALERPFPIRGWTLPGVMTVGAAQILLKTSGMLATGRVVLAGCGPLLWLLAAQYVAAGRPPTAILDTTPAANWRAALRAMPEFLASPYLRKGLPLMLRVRRAVRVVGGVTELAVEGEGRAQRVTFRRGGGAPQSIEAEHVLLHQGVVPNVNLASAVGLPLAWDEAQACFHPRADEWGSTELPGIAVAGDGAGIAGAEAAAARGTLAGLEAARALGAIDAAARDRLAAPARAA